MVTRYGELEADVLSKLKDFQRKTVEYVFQRLYLDSPNTSRFLVADEVGLGKTLVARGIIAKTLMHLDQKVDRIDVVYVCSNATIATQNINRLNVLGNKDLGLATRLTMLPSRLKDLRRNHVNFISFTPGTTFDLKSRGGVVDERALLFRLLSQASGAKSTPLRNVLQLNVGLDRWLRVIGETPRDLDSDLGHRFLKAVAGNAGLQERLGEQCEVFLRARSRIPPRDVQERRLSLVGELRQTLARVCVDALAPDLVILDEFQRFKDLLDGDDEAAELARPLLQYPDVRVLLLSATPYRMLTLDQESEEDHHQDFLRTLEFLFGGREPVEDIKRELHQLRRALYGLADTSEIDAVAARDSVQMRLLKVMARTERVAMTTNLDAMVSEPPVPTPLGEDDLRQVVAIDRLASLLKAGDTIEYWKSSPYLLNFMKGYKLRERLDAAEMNGADGLRVALEAARDTLLTKAQIDRYARLDPGNARLRGLFRETLDAGLWQLLWMPPSLPYLEPGGAYATAGAITKALIFSSWRVVPDTIATLASFEAERRMLDAGHVDAIEYSELTRKKRARLVFTVETDTGRATGMPTLALLYPCATFANLIDPIGLALEHGAGRPVPAVQALAVVRQKLDVLLHEAGLATESGDGPVDQRWYWAAPAILDARFEPAMAGWAGQMDALLAEELEDDGDEAASQRGHEGLRAHLAQFEAVFTRRPSLGRPPDDLLDVLAELALAGPGTCALRALHRAASSLDLSDPELLRAASEVSSGFRTLFNLPETMGLLRADDEAVPYWRRVLRHGLDGNLQAVLDEYVHVLRESLGLSDRDPHAVVRGIAEAAAEALSIRTALLRVDEPVVKATDSKVVWVPLSVRCRFALRLADVQDDRENTVARAGTVRQAFNSPFRPFVLASTSIGQEGLDFHPYCHVLYHWNLPNNPVDMEQREGRIQRFKGHAVRKNVAQRFGLACLKERWDHRSDPWDVLFDAALESRPPGSSELIPYWIYEVEGGAQIERRAPILPLSKEVAQLKRLKRGLAMYRLVFGQPRQEDLLAYLEERAAEGDWASRADRWRISLAPPEVNGTAPHRNGDKPKP